VELEQILALIVFSLMHWVLALMLLEDLADRKRVLGGRKWPWAIAIVFITFIGSLVYLLLHPKILYGSDDKDGP
jgi:hypothetical protein